MSKEKKERGRPSTKYDEDEIYKIIKHYRDNVKPQGDIKFLQLYKYHLELYNEQPDICSKIYSEDFWRKKGQPGRNAIDTANQIRTVTLVDSNNNKKDIPNVVDVVNKYLKDPERLIKHLIPLENEVRRSIEKESELKDKNNKLKEQLEEAKREKRNQINQINILKECIIKQFHYSYSEGTPLENLLNMNNKNKRIKKALEEVWRSPQDFYTELISFQQQTTSELNKKDNIVTINDAKRETKRTIAEEFEGRF